MHGFFTHYQAGLYQSKHIQYQETQGVTIYVIFEEREKHQIVMDKEVENIGH